MKIKGQYYIYEKLTKNNAVCCFTHAYSQQVYLYKSVYKAVLHNVFLIVQSCYRDAKHWNYDTEDRPVEDRVYRNSIFSIQQKDYVGWKFI
jgi:hypothetical protein